VLGARDWVVQELAAVGWGSEVAEEVWGAY